MSDHRHAPWPLPASSLDASAVLARISSFTTATTFVAPDGELHVQVPSNQFERSLRAVSSQGSHAWLDWPYRTARRVSFAPDDGALLVCIDEEDAGQVSSTIPTAHTSRIALVDSTLTFRHGPIRELASGALSFDIRTDGERVSRLKVDSKAGDRSIRARLRGKSAAQSMALVSRICAHCSIAASWSFAMAVERAAMASDQVPPRAIALRTLYSEIERIRRYLSLFRDLSDALGLPHASAKFAGADEEIALRLSHVFGQRWLFDLIAIGGVTKSISPADYGHFSEIRTTARGAAAYFYALCQRTGVADRLEGLGTASVEVAMRAAATGIAARASRLFRDLRRSRLYGAYGQCDFQLSAGGEGDVLSRARLCADELIESAALIGQLLDGMPSGEHVVELDLEKASGVGHGWCEGAGGEWLVGCEIEAGRVKEVAFASPARSNSALLAEVAGARAGGASGRLSGIEGEPGTGVLLSDLYLVELSFALCSSCTSETGGMQ